MAGFDPDKYLAQKESGFDPDAYLAAQGDMDVPEVIEEMHPAFSTADRLAVKNFGNNPQASAEYLKSKHPDLDVRADESGRIMAKAPGESQYRVLDPDTGLFSTDILRDAGDIIFDVGSGVANSAATAAGGVAGSVAGPGGALGGAALAGGASSGGLEAIRQAIGRALGVNQEISGADIGVATGAGAVSPLLFGTGATGAQVAKQGAKTFAAQADEFLTADAARKSLEDSIRQVGSSQRGLIGMGIDKARETFLPNLGQAASGVTADAIKFTRDNLGALENLEAGEITPFIAGKRETWKQAIDGAQEKIGQKIGATIDESIGPGEISIGTARKPFEDLIQRLEAVVKDVDNPEAMDALAQARNMKSRFFESQGGGAPTDYLLGLQGLPVAQKREFPDRLPAKSAWELKQFIDDVTDLARTAPKSGELVKANASSSYVDKRLLGSAKAASSALRKELDKVPGLEPLNKQYTELSGYRRTLNQFFKGDEQKTLDRLSAATTKSSTFEKLKKADQLLGTDITQTAQLLDATKRFTKAPWQAISSQGTTSTSRSAPLGIAGAAAGAYLGANSGSGQGGAIIGGGLGGLLGATIGGPKALRAYMEAGRGLDKASNYLRNAPVMDKLRPLQSAPMSAWQSLQFGGER